MAQKAYKLFQCITLSHLASSLNMPIFLSLLLLTLPVPTQQYLVNRKQLCVNACRNAFADAIFATTDETLEGSYWHCSDTLRIASSYLCAEQHCLPDELRAGVYQFEDRCRMEADMVILLFEALLANATLGRGEHSFHDAKFNGVGKAEVDAGLKFNVTVFPSDELFVPAYRTWVSGGEGQPLNGRYRPWHFCHHLFSFRPPYSACPRSPLITSHVLVPFLSICR